MNKESKSYKTFLNAYDDVELSDLSDEDLQAFHDLCQNGVIDAEEELRRREFGAGR